MCRIRLNLMNYYLIMTIEYAHFHCLHSLLSTKLSAYIWMAVKSSCLRKFLRRIVFLLSRNVVGSVGSQSVWKIREISFLKDPLLIKWSAVFELECAAVLVQLIIDRVTSTWHLIFQVHNYRVQIVVLFEILRKIIVY